MGVTPTTHLQSRRKGSRNPRTKSKKHKPNPPSRSRPAPTPARPPLRPICKYSLRSTSRYFVYTALDGTRQYALSRATGEPLECVNDYVFHPPSFAREPYPATFPASPYPALAWPPTAAAHVLCDVGAQHADCVGARCFEREVCADAGCGHSFEAWKAATEDWESRFELRETRARGIGVFVRRGVRLREGEILGWYAGEVKTWEQGWGDYLMEMDVGDGEWWGGGEYGEEEMEGEKGDDYGVVEEEEAEDNVDGDRTHEDAGSVSESDEVSAPECSVFIDAEQQGNWTRFINHSCDQDAYFSTMRVGGIRIMAVVASRDVEAGQELTVNYGSEYYSVGSSKVCGCRSANCVERKKAAEPQLRA